MAEYWKKYVWNTRPVQYPLNTARGWVQPMWNTKFTASQITDKIWLSGFASACNKEELDKRGIKNVITIIYGVGEQHPNQGINYLIVPVIDDASVDISKHFAETGAFIAKCIAMGESVLVHCAAGKSRSATIVAAYLIKYEGMEAYDAISYLKQKRETCDPNPGFVKRLRDYSDLINAERRMNATILDPFVNCSHCLGRNVFTDGKTFGAPAKKYYFCNSCGGSWLVPNNVKVKTVLDYPPDKRNSKDDFFDFNIDGTD